MPTWATIKDQARRLLKDTTPNEDTGLYKWSDTELLDFIGWSLDALCTHTAIATATSFEVNGQSYDLPDNIYETIERSGAVYTDDGVTKHYLNPVRFNKIPVAQTGYYINPGNILYLVQEPTDTNLTVLYFAYYPHPSQDSDELLTPTWATSALVYRMAAYAMMPFAARSSNIRQWGRYPDTGKPTDNPLQNQAWNFLEMWEKELSNYPVQQRENYWRTS